MYNAHQKRLAIKYLLLSAGERDEISKLLPEENMFFLRRIIGELSEVGISAENIACIQNEIQLDDIDENACVGDESQLLREIKKFVTANHQPVPKKLYEFLALAEGS